MKKLTKLSELRIPRRSFTIELTQGEELDISVRGLNFLDISEIIKGSSRSNVLEAVNKYGDQLTFGDEYENDTSLSNAMMQIMRDFPTLVAKIIAVAVDDDTPEGIAGAGLIPLSVQIEMLKAVFDLTFVGEEALKKALETVTLAIQGTRSAIGLALTSTDGSTPSA